MEASRTGSWRLPALQSRQRDGGSRSCWEPASLVIGPPRPPRPQQQREGSPAYLRLGLFGRLAVSTNKPRGIRRRLALREAFLMNKCDTSPYLRHTQRHGMLDCSRSGKQPLNAVVAPCWLPGWLFTFFSQLTGFSLDEGDALLLLTIHYSLHLYSKSSTGVYRL